ncbi:PREDICTED: jmjC domain-containing protein 4 [Nelumbo nucifera]|uniref:JmjC domain-containing protein 4 n=1 Tax=Nelumbo nucifera TaxID=4432 RepID=A0A1U7Z814_NELNU|nr:PREDICTED: jmjC domain-containing protein 4 [Nelumbo nucifera]
MGLNIGGHVEKVNGKELSYSEFVKRYLEKNQPVVLTGLMDDWKACRDWVYENGNPNLHYFSAHFGKSRVQVADCGSKEFTDQKRVEMSVSEFIDHWLKLPKEDGSYSNRQGNDQTVLYLKDWHFVKEYPDYVVYTTPLFFRDDWLNIYLDGHPMHRDPHNYQKTNEINCSDYRFVYMGAKGTWTPLHADVFRSYSWSANVCGKKQWHLLSPSQCHLVFDRNMKNSVYDIFADVPEKKFPGFREAIWLECTQERNEIIFVPSGWYHQVHNLEDTISINHNWFNAYNLSWVWELLVKDYNEAKEYIEDIRDICDDFEGLCQRNLAANTGMNLLDFFICISRFSFANLIQLYHLVRNYSNFTRDPLPRIQYLIINLTCLCKVALKMESMESLSGNEATLVGVLEVIGQSEFLDLCIALNGTYETVIGPTSDINYSLGNNLVEMDFMEDYDFKVSNPKDLITVIECVLNKVGCFSSNKNINLFSKLSDIKSQWLCKR